MSENEGKSKHVFDSGKEMIGATYAKALIGAAEKSGELERVVKDLETSIDEVVAKLPKLATALDSPRVPPESKERLLEACFKGKVSTTLLNFYKVVCQHGRFDCISEIRAAVRKQYNERRGLVEIEIRTAAPLPASIIERIVDRLKQMLGKDVAVKTKIQPELIGGVVVKVGDTLYDGSVSRRLELMKGKAMASAKEALRHGFERFSVAS